MNKKVLWICHAAMIAALYVVLTLCINAFGLASGAIQVRISEALTILPYFTPAAIPGLVIGCLISNTLLGALGSYALRRFKWLVPLPPIIANTLIVPYVLRIAYGVEDGIFYLMGTVCAGEILSCYVLGMILLFALDKSHKSLFAKKNA